MGTTPRRQIIQDRINFRRYRTACEHYRENWSTAEALYQVICLRDMPPETAEDQERCFLSRNGCWREKYRRRGGRSA